MVETITPLVSVIIPAFNGEKTIEKTISSILDQNFSSFELIVIDDGSSDATASVVELSMNKAIFLGDFTLVRHESNMGLSKTLNDGVKRTRGRFVLILHQDCEFVGNDWIAKASSLMDDENVAVVTGYYGLSESADETFVKRAFGILRMQFHSRPQISCEEVTFSEGKCDLYRKDSLLKAGGFPTSFRIAGEDLVVSYKLRSMGNKILKCYDLPVIQKFTGAAETFRGNLGKEFLFGKVMGGVFLEFNFFLFRNMEKSNYSRSRSIHRSTQPVFIFLLLLSFILSVLFNLMFVLVFVGLIGYRCLYYFNKVLKELSLRGKNMENPFREALAIVPIGLLTDFCYTFGFVYGSISYLIKKRL